MIHFRRKVASESKETVVTATFTKMNQKNAYMVLFERDEEQMFACFSKNEK